MNKKTQSLLIMNIIMMIIVIIMIMSMVIFKIILTGTKLLDVSETSGFQIIEASGSLGY